MNKLIAIVFLVSSQTGCAVYTVASTAAFVTTDKTLTDHAATLAVPNANCSSMQVLKGQYYCEVRDISVTYNRSSF